MIIDNLRRIQAEMEAACLRSNRLPSDVLLIAVSKTQPEEAIREAYEAGQRVFGENKAQDLIRKKQNLPEDICWHFIGSLQRNKVKYLVGEVALIHSVNSPALALEIEKVAARRGLVQDILIEVNIAEEESKHGSALPQAEEILRMMPELTHVKARGLMAVAPFSDNAETVRPYFIKMRELLDIWKPLLPDPEAFCQLSMGMSGDFEVAIEEGASYIRVGTALFGARHYASNER